MTQPIPLGPWPLGVDNVHAPSHRVFQVPGQGQPPARLRGATDVDLDDEGWPSARAGLASVRSPVSTVPPGYQLAWSDEFDGDALDTTKWDYRLDSRFLSTQLAANVSVSGGKLLLAVKKEDVGETHYTAGGVISKREFRYGYYESRLKVPPGAGWHTSFWMMKHTVAEAIQEVDVFENNSVNLTDYAVNFHKWHPVPHEVLGYLRVSSPDLSQDFHTLGCEFTETEARYYLDGDLVQTVDVSEVSHGDQSIWLTVIGYDPDGGTNVDDALLPSAAEYEYVRFYERADNPVIAPVEGLLSAPVGLWEVGGRMFLQDADVLYEDTTRLVSGLRRRVVLASHAGLIFGTDGAQHFVLDGTTVSTWGLPVPDVTVVAVPGALAAGRYLVQASFVDAAGNEGGVSPLATVDLTAGQSLLVTVSPAREASLVRIYASGPDGPHTSLALEAAASRGSYLLHSVAYADALPPVTEQMRGPISNAAGVASFRAFLLCWRENFVVRSEGAEPHLFHPDNILQFPGTVTACVGLDVGLWVGTTAGLYWIAGEGPEAWIPRLANPGAVLAGSLKVSGTKLPAVQGRDPVALFVASNGLLAGLPSGEALSLTENRYTFSDGSRASLAYAERDPLRQLFVCVEE